MGVLEVEKSLPAFDADGTYAMPLIIVQIRGRSGGMVSAYLKLKIQIEPGCWPLKFIRKAVRVKLAFVFPRT